MELAGVPIGWDPNRDRADGSCDPGGPQVPSYPFRAHQPVPAADRPLATDETLVELRCSVIVSRGQDVLLLRRRREGDEEWVLPGGRPRTGEGMLACARREVAEETGLAVIPERCAFVADVVAPEGGRRRAELVFVAKVAANHDEELAGEDGVEPAWVPVADIRHLNLRPPIAGFLPAVVLGQAPTAPYLGNLWRPDDTDGSASDTDDAASGWR
jgi:ADP-ribose pyrophosphatase YjhB (NUDIX family)